MLHLSGHAGQQSISEPDHDKKDNGSSATNADHPKPKRPASATNADHPKPKRPASQCVPALRCCIIILFVSTCVIAAVVQVYLYWLYNLYI